MLQFKNNQNNTIIELYVSYSNDSKDEKKEEDEDDNGDDYSAIKHICFTQQN